MQLFIKGVDDSSGFVWICVDYKHSIYKAYRGMSEILNNKVESHKNKRLDLIDGGINGEYDLNRCVDITREDIYLAFYSIASNDNSLKDMSEELRNNREVVMCSILANPMSLEYASSSLRNDRDLVMRAVLVNGRSLEFASTELRNEVSVLNGALDCTYAMNATTYVSYPSDGSLAPHNDIDNSIKSQMNAGSVLKWAGEKVLRDKETVLKAIYRGFCEWELIEDYLLGFDDVLATIVVCNTANSAVLKDKRLSGSRSIMDLFENNKRAIYLAVGKIRAR